MNWLVAMLKMHGLSKRENNRNVGALVVYSFTIHEDVLKKVECRVDVGSTCLDLLLAIISRVFQLIFVKFNSTLCTCFVYISEF